jgi:hypothetical protein
MGTRRTRASQRSDEWSDASQKARGLSESQEVRGAADVSECGDCEAPAGVGAPFVGDMTEFGAVEIDALQTGRLESFHGTCCSETTFRRSGEWVEPRKPAVFVSDHAHDCGVSEEPRSAAIYTRTRGHEFMPYV